MHTPGSHKPTHFSRSALLMALAVATITFATSSASAQTGRYRVTPVKNINFTPSIGFMGTAGINNKGQIVYAYSTDGEIGPFKAFVWLPNADYGYIIPGAYDLAACSGSSVARDINMSGYIAGQTGGVVTISGRAAMWQLSGGSSTCSELPTLGGDPNYGGAYAVNDENPPVIVGEASRQNDCRCGLTADLGVSWPFRYTVGAATLLEYSPLPSVSGGARDVTTPAACIVGLIDCFGSSGAFPCDNPGAQCMDTRQPARWINPLGALTMSALDSPKGSEVHGVNQSLESVGWGFIGLPPCIRRACYWSSLTAAPDDISGFPILQNSRAEAINNASPRQIIGSNVSTNRAYLWEKNPFGGWTSLELSSADAIGCHENRWIIRQGHDINDYGQIVAYAEYLPGDSPNVPPGKYLVLLTPCTPGLPDMSCDGCIDMDDLLAVIGTWGNSCLNGPCNLGDVDFNCTVDIDDLLAVVGYWCPDVCEDDAWCLGCKQCQEGEGLMSGMNLATNDIGIEMSNPPTTGELILLVLQSAQPAEVQTEIITQLLEQH